MSVWTTKASGRAREYVVIKHKLRGVNSNIGGVKFRDSFAVVEKNSKTYLTLKRMPIIQKEDLPLEILKKLPFVTRTSDIQTVFGTEVYVHFLEKYNQKVIEEKVEQKVQEEIKHVEEKKLCAYRTDASNGKNLCKQEPLEHSPSQYCLTHIILDPRLQELGIDVPKFIPKKEKADLRLKVSEQLKQLSKKAEANG